MGILLFAPRGALAVPDACIPDDARTRALECPADLGRRSAGARRAAVPPASASARPTGRRPSGGPGLQPPTPPSIVPRDLELARRELALVQRLLRDTPASDARFAVVIARLARLHDEIAAALNAQGRSLDDPIHGAVARREGRRAEQLRARQARAFAERDEMRRAAVEARVRLIRDAPNARDLDQAIYDLAAGLEELGDAERAGVAYRHLLRSFPQSTFVPAALVALGERAFSARDLDGARGMFERVVRDGRSPLVAWAQYRIAWCALASQDDRAALAAFERAIDFARRRPDVGGADAIARQSRRELIGPYARIGDAARARERFRGLAGGPEELRTMLGLLANEYVDGGQWDAALAVLGDLLAREGDRPERCVWQADRLRATIASRPRDEQIREARTLAAMDRGLAPACRARAAGAVLDLAVAWHRESVGTGDQPGTGDRATMARTRDLYELALRSFPDLDALPLEGAAAARPTSARLLRWKAELLWAMDDHAGCGPAFDAALAASPRTPDAAEVAYASALCWDRVLSQTEHPDPQEAEAAARSFARAECVAPDDPMMPELRYRRAQLLEGLGRREEAAVLYERVATRGPSAAAAAAAAERHLGILAALARAGRSACDGALEESVPRLRAALCDGPADARPGSCGRLEVLELRVERRRAGRLAERREFRAAADTALAAADRFPSAEGVPEVLFDAALWLDAARLVGRAIRVRQQIVEGHPGTEPARRALYLNGASYHALAMYRKAAETYEDFAQRFPGDVPELCTAVQKRAGTCTDAPAALRHATVFRVGLGETDRAIADARTFERLWGSRRRAEAAEVSFSLGSLYESAGDWPAAARHWTDWLRRWSRNADPGAVVLANAALGRAESHRGDAEAARRAWNAALAAWDAWPGRRAAASDDPEVAARRLAVRSAAAEARLGLAEVAYERFLAVRWRPYRGGASRERFQRWLQHDFAAWHDEEQARLAEARAAYDSVAELGVPHYQIAAAARVGEMVRRFFTAFRAAPVPPEVARDPELRAIYGGELDRLSEPVRRDAIARFQDCVDRATQVRWFNEWSLGCEQELHRLEPAVWPLAAELRSSPDFVASEPVRPGLAVPRS